MIIASHRRHLAVLSRFEQARSGVWWAPAYRSWWIGVLFAIGSLCFLVGPAPGFVQLVGSDADGIVFFVGSIFFTTAALLEVLQSRGGADWSATLIQLVGTVFFNISTYEAMQDALSTSETDRLVWAPDALGSICFLVSGLLAYAEVQRGHGFRPQEALEWRIAAINLAGCVLFGIAAIASYVVPDTGSILDLAAANVTTALGALCFLVGALLLLPASAAVRPGAQERLGRDNRA